MKLQVVTTAFFPKPLPYLGMFLSSAAKYGINVHLFGLGEPYCIWAVMKIARKLPMLEKLRDDGYTHILYTDGRDAFFTGPMEEILEKYKLLGSPPCLASTEPNCNPDPSKAPNYPDLGKYRYHCVGGYLAEIPWMEDKFHKMLPRVASQGDDAAIWQEAWEEEWFRPQLDSLCMIFQTLDHCEMDLDVRDGRLVNTRTGQYPCIFHLNGGYSDPVRGKWDYMLPWWTRVHPELRVEEPPKEEE